MPSSNLLESQQSDAVAVAVGSAHGVAGAWKLLPGRALSLHTRRRSVLEIARGRVWLTVRDRAPDSASTDQVLCAGDRITIEPGQHVVMEPWEQSGTDFSAPVAFRWDVVLAGPTAAAQSSASVWQTDVVAPLRDLVAALGTGARALGRAVSDAGSASGRLVIGMARWVVFEVVGRGGAARLGRPSDGSCRAAPCGDAAL